jgi:hypothetical protein
MYMVMLLIFPHTPHSTPHCTDRERYKDREIKRMYMIILLIFPLLPILLLIAQAEKDIKIKRG